MPLDLPEGDRCFVDTNVFYYHFVNTPPLSSPCSTLLERAVNGTIEVYTSLPILADAVHKVMLAEAAMKLGRDRAGLVNWLQRNQYRIAELSEFRETASELRVMDLSLLPMDVALLEAGSTLSVQFGLLTNDALIVAMMQQHGLTNLVTNDDDFDSIPGLTVWKPR